MAEQLTKNNEQVKASRALNRIESFKGFVDGFTEKGRKSTRNRVSKRLGKMLFGTPEDSGVSVESGLLLDRELGQSLAQQAVEMARTGTENGAIKEDDKSVTSVARTEDGLIRYLKIDTHAVTPGQAQVKDQLTFTITNMGTEGAYDTVYSVDRTGRVTMTGADGETQKVHANTEAAERITADLSSFSAPEPTPELPF